MEFFGRRSYEAFPSQVVWTGHLRSTRAQVNCINVAGVDGIMITHNAFLPIGNAFPASRVWFLTQGRVRWQTIGASRLTANYNSGAEHYKEKRPNNGRWCEIFQGKEAKHWALSTFVGVIKKQLSWRSTFAAAYCIITFQGRPSAPPSHLLPLSSTFFALHPDHRIQTGATMAGPHNLSSPTADTPPKVLPSLHPSDNSTFPADSLLPSLKAHLQRSLKAPLHQSLKALPQASPEPTLSADDRD
ncbi:hypothetical protein H4Q26_003919 [Puccinia striiformis f. sp. tritici PST-130]|nr:hypothetical protein H4Q26_003919 [Puccinia striiformis f. sp. tritici PST-130]